MFFSSMFSKGKLAELGSMKCKMGGSESSAKVLEMN